jgi:hypothetical protein
MAISEAQRHHLHTVLDGVLGPEDAVVLMSHLPPSGWSDVVRTSDLDLRLAVVEQRIDILETRIEARFEAIDHRFDAVEARFETRLHQLSNQLFTRMAGLAGLVLALDQLLSRI